MVEVLNAETNVVRTPMYAVKIWSRDCATKKAWMVLKTIQALYQTPFKFVLSRKRHGPFFTNYSDLYLTRVLHFVLDFLRDHK